MISRSKCAVLALLVLAFAILIVPASSQAVGLGISVGLKDGSTNYDNSTTNFGFKATGFNFILDTAVAKDKVFNYRLGLGYEKETFDVGTREVGRFALTNTFGFGVLRTEAVRLWLGPQIFFAYGSDDTYHDLDAGAAFVLGTNFAVGPVVSLGLELGYGIGFHRWEVGRLDNDGLRNNFFLSGVLLFRIHDEYLTEEGD